MKTLTDIYRFGGALGVTLTYGEYGWGCCFNLADGRELACYTNGRMVVGDLSYIPPATVLHEIGKDLEYVAKTGLDSDPERYLEHFRTVEQQLRAVIEELEFQVDEQKIAEQHEKTEVVS